MTDTVKTTSSTNDTHMKDHMAKHLKEELEGCNGYLAMAKKAFENKDLNLSSYIAEMARDEMSHARFIKKYMEYKGINLDTETQKLYDSTMEAFKSF